MLSTEEVGYWGDSWGVSTGNSIPIACQVKSQSGQVALPGPTSRRIESRSMSEFLLTVWATTYAALLVWLVVRVINRPNDWAMAITVAVLVGCTGILVIGIQIIGTDLR
jgi:hypothetical protein